MSQLWELATDREDGQGGLVCYSPWGRRVGQGSATELTKLLPRTSDLIWQPPSASRSRGFPASGTLSSLTPRQELQFHPLLLKAGWIGYNRSWPPPHARPPQLLPIETLGCFLHYHLARSASKYLLSANQQQQQRRAGTILGAEQSRQKP